MGLRVSRSAIQLPSPESLHLMVSVVILSKLWSLAFGQTKIKVPRPKAQGQRPKTKTKASANDKLKNMEIIFPFFPASSIF
jgi:hypothetical protein